MEDRGYFIAMNKYWVWMRSKPGMYEQYNGKVEVCADNDDAAIIAAHKKLKAGAFPDRNASMWIVEKIERVF